MNQYRAINLNGNGEDLSDINLKLLRPKAFAEFLLGLTCKKWAEDDKENVEKGIKEENKNTDCENENEHSNKNAILSNIEKVKKMNPNNFIGKGKFSNLPNEIKVVMLQQIFEFRDETKFDSKKSLSKNVNNMILKYQKYPKDVLLNILKLCLNDMTEKLVSKKDLPNQINEINNTTNDDFSDCENLAEAIKKILDDDNCLLNDEQLTLFYEYYGCFSATQNEIKEITGQKDFFGAIKKIEEHNDYKDINNKNLKNAFLRGRLKACNHKWNFNQDLLQKLSFDEQMIIIPHLIIAKKNQNNNEQNQQQNELIVKYIEKPKDFANLLNVHFSDENGKLSNEKNIKIQAEIINNNVLTAAFFSNAIAGWLKYISKENYDLLKIPDDIIAKLVHVASQKCDTYDFFYDLSSLDIDELLDFYAKSEVQNKIEISSKKDENHQETMTQKNIQLLQLHTENSFLKTKNSALIREKADLLRGLKLKDKECKKYACNIEAKKAENSLSMPIYICLCAAGVAFAGFMLWLISLISVTWAIVQMSIFIVGILFLLVMTFIADDNHKTFDLIAKCLIVVLVLANLPVIFVQLIVLCVTFGYIDRHIQNRVNLKYPLNTIYKKPSKQTREDIAGIEVIVEERWHNDINNNQLVVGNNHQQQNDI